MTRPDSGGLERRLHSALQSGPSEAVPLGRGRRVGPERMGEDLNPLIFRGLSMPLSWTHLEGQWEEGRPGERIEELCVLEDPQLRAMKWESK